MSARTLTSTIITAVALTALAACATTSAGGAATGVVGTGTGPAGTAPATVTPAPAASNTASSPAPTHSAPAVATTTKSLGAANPLPGSLTYVDLGDVKPNPYLFTWAPGSSSLTGIKFTGDAGAMYSSGAVSPDGRHVTWVNVGDKRQTANGLYIANVDGSQSRLLAKNIAPFGIEPTWSPDSTSLIVQDATDYSVGVIDIATGKITKLAHEVSGVHVMWSADGTTLAYSDGQGSVIIAAPDGGTIRTVAGIGKSVNYQVRVANMESLSSDGSELAVIRHTGDTPDGDAGRSLYSNAIIDTTTGKVVPLPVAGTMIAARFVPTGGVLIRLSGKTHNTLVLVSASGDVLQQLPEPAALLNYAILDYTTP